jgi:superoxide dismutase, Cu-Zn family
MSKKTQKNTSSIKRKAVCQVRSSIDDKIKGYVTFVEEEKRLKVVLDLHGLPKGKRGFHIHQAGNLLEGCTSLSSHFNPEEKTHGALNHNKAHAGDLGNIEINMDGKLKKTIYSKKLRLHGKYNIIGRSVVIHEKIDDLGTGNNKESLKTGNAGKRIACGIIGYY